MLFSTFDIFSLNFFGNFNFLYFGGIFWSFFRFLFSRGSSKLFHIVQCMLWSGVVWWYVVIEELSKLLVCDVKTDYMSDFISSLQSKKCYPIVKFGRTKKKRKIWEKIRMMINFS